MSVGRVAADDEAAAGSEAAVRGRFAPFVGRDVSAVFWSVTSGAVDVEGRGRFPPVVGRVPDVEGFAASAAAPYNVTSGPETTASMGDSGREVI